MRDVNIEEIFSRENNSYPPSLSKNADLRSGKKSHLLMRLGEVVSATCQTSAVECVILYGAAVVNFLKLIGVATFEDYANDIFKPYIERQLKDSRRIDIVWDEYIPNSLKSSTRTKRGTGTRKRVLPDSKIPANWQSFLRLEENKQELFKFLAAACITIETQCTIIIQLFSIEIQL